MKKAGGQSPPSTAPSTAGRAQGLIGALRRDRLLLIATVVMGIAVVAPLLRTPFVPLHDAPDHAGLAAIFGRALFGSSTTAEHFDVRLVPVPYLTSYFVQYIVGIVTGSLVAVKVLVALSLLLTPLGVMRLMVALDRDPRLGLAAFLLSWEHSLYWGFTAYTLAVGLSFFALAAIVEADDVRACLRRAVPWGVVVALSHAQTAALLGAAAMALVLARRPLRPRLVVHAVGAFVPWLALVPWVLSALFGQETARANTGPIATWDDLPTKVTKLFEFTLDGLPDATGRTAMALAFALLLFAPLGFAALRRRPPSLISSAGPGLLFAASVLLYFALPMGISRPIEPWYIYPRMATFMLLAALVVPKPDLQGLRAAWLLPIVFAALFVDVQVGKQMASFAERARPFLSIIDAVPEESKFLTLTLDDGDPAVKLSPYNQFHGYVLAEKGGYDAYEFEARHFPVVLDLKRALPHPEWNRMRDFSFDKHGVHFDYIIVQGLQRDPLVSEARVELITEAGRWRLYKVRR